MLLGFCGELIQFTFIQDILSHVQETGIFALYREDSQIIRDGWHIWYGEKWRNRMAKP